MKREYDMSEAKRGAVIPTKMKTPSMIAGIRGILRNCANHRAALARDALGAITILPEVCSAIFTTSSTYYLIYHGPSTGTGTGTLGVTYSGVDISVKYVHSQSGCHVQHRKYHDHAL